MSNNRAPRPFPNCHGPKSLAWHSREGRMLSTVNPSPQPLVGLRQSAGSEESNGSSFACGITDSPNLNGTLSSLILPPCKAVSWSSGAGGLIVSPSGSTSPTAISGRLGPPIEGARSSIYMQSGADVWASPCRVCYFQNSLKKRLAILA